MILVTVGSMAPFDELVKEADRLVGEGLLDGGVAQIGEGRYIPRNLVWFRFKKDLTEEYRRADLVITHTGAGTLFELLELGKRAIAVPNPHAIHNPDIALKLSAEGHILLCNREEDLKRYVIKAKEWVPREYKPPPCRIHEVIAECLQKV